jgi:hypothetical protein
VAAPREKTPTRMSRAAPPSPLRAARPLRTPTAAKHRPCAAAKTRWRGRRSGSTYACRDLHGRSSPARSATKTVVNGAVLSRDRGASCSFRGTESDPWTRPNRVLTNSEMKMQGGRRCSRCAQGELTRFWQWALAKNAAGHVGSHQRAPRAREVQGRSLRRARSGLPALFAAEAMPLVPF